MEEENA
jgi:hypothetical protein